MSQEFKTLEEKVTEIKTIVYKTLVDPSTVKIVGEREKCKYFMKLGLIRPKPDDVQLQSLEKYYDTFLVINGRYLIDYYRKRIYKLEVEDDVSEVIIFNQVLKPNMPTNTKLRRKVGEIEVEAEQRIINENSAYKVFDKTGHEVELKNFPIAPAEEEPKKVLAEAGDKVWNLEISPNKSVGIFRSNIVNRPKNLERINRELFEVSEYNLVYVPIYYVTYKNIKTEDVKTIRVSGITSKVLPKRNESGVRAIEKLCSKCGKSNNKDAKFCRHCGCPL